MTFLQLVYFYVLMVVFTFQNITDASEELCLFICMPLLSTQTRGWGYWEWYDCLLDLSYRIQAQMSFA